MEKRRRGIYELPWDCMLLCLILGYSCAWSSCARCRWTGEEMERCTRKMEHREGAGEGGGAGQDGGRRRAEEGQEDGRLCARCLGYISGIPLRSVNARICHTNGPGRDAVVERTGQRALALRISQIQIEAPSHHITINDPCAPPRVRRLSSTIASSFTSGNIPGPLLPNPTNDVVIA